MLSMEHPVTRRSWHTASSGHPPALGTPSYHTGGTRSPRVGCSHQHQGAAGGPWRPPLCLCRIELHQQAAPHKCLALLPVKWKIPRWATGPSRRSKLAVFLGRLKEWLWRPFCNVLLAKADGCLSPGRHVLWQHIMGAFLSAPRGPSKQTINKRGLTAHATSCSWYYCYFLTFSQSNQLLHYYLITK